MSIVQEELGNEDHYAKQIHEKVLCKIYNYTVYKFNNKQPYLRLELGTSGKRCNKLAVIGLARHI